MLSDAVRPARRRRAAWPLPLGHRGLCTPDAEAGVARRPPSYPRVRREALEALPRLEGEPHRAGAELTRPARVPAGAGLRRDERAAARQRAAPPHPAPRARPRAPRAATPARAIRAPPLAPRHLARPGRPPGPAQRRPPAW